MSDVKVLIVEDSAPTRLLLRDAISSSPGLRVVGTASCAESCLEMLEQLQPDVITMDILLPGMDGLEATRQIMCSQPTPIVVVSAKLGDSGVSMEALRAGALSVAEKLPDPQSADYPILRKRLCDQLLAMSQVSVIRQRSFGRAAVEPVKLPSRNFEAVGIVTSTGGPSAVAELLTSLAPSVRLPILLVQHMTTGFLEGYVHWLEEKCPQSVVLAEHGMRLQEGTVFVAPSDKHLSLRERNLVLEDGPPVCFHRPSGDVLLGSMAEALGRHAIGVVLTGMGRDGAEGLARIKEAGGYTLCQDPATAPASSIPAVAVELGAAKEVLTLPILAERLNQLASSAREA